MNICVVVLCGGICVEYTPASVSGGKYEQEKKTDR
jgi:hypothetical protein